METRKKLISQFKNPNDQNWDVIIIGGGANGMGCAWQAAEQGYRVLLLEKGDFASGTSSKSTKLLHGGVRYLEQGNFSLVSEALAERKLLLDEFGELSTRISILIPFQNIFTGIYFWIGMKLYDLLSGKRSIGKAGWVNKKHTLKRLNNLKKNAKGSIQYYDGQFDDAGFCSAIAESLNSSNSVALNYIKVNDFLFEDKKVNGVIAEDLSTGETFHVNGKIIINATGVEADLLIKKADKKDSEHIVSSKGAHIVVDKSFLSKEDALLIPRTSDGRVVFIIPWKNRLIIGTTDTPTSELNTNPKVSQEDLSYLMETANRFLDKPIEKKDIKAVFAGLRSLVKPPGNKATKDINRSHSIIIGQSKLISVLGGKWTSFRKIGKDALITIKKEGLLEEASKTASFKLKITTSDSDKIKETIHDALPYSWLEIERYLNESMVVNIDDLLLRRTRCMMLDVEACKEIKVRLIDFMANNLGMDQNWKSEQSERFEEIIQYYDPKSCI